MIIVTFTITVKPEQRDKVLTELDTLVKASRKEAGCLSYGFYTDVWEPNLLRTYQEWESRAALKEHVQTSHIAAWFEARDKFIAADVLESYSDTLARYQATLLSGDDL